MSLLSTNFITNELSVKERWWKLYRKVFHKFLKEDFTHQKDIKLMLKQLNTRLQTIEANMAAGDAAVMAAMTTTTTAIQAALAGHTHVVPQAPAGATTSAPPAGLPPLPPSPPAPGPTTPEITYMDQNLLARDAQLQGLGPATSPLGDGNSPEALKATITAKSNIGA